jgi:hypothetical protein
MPGKNAAPLQHPYLPTATGFVPLTADHPPFWHLEWIKTNAAILRESFDDIERLAANRQQPILGEIDRQLRIVESQQLAEFHTIRIVLRREVERYLPHFRIPVLGDFTRAWQWNAPLPDKPRFIREMQRVEYSANLLATRILDSQAMEERASPDHAAISNPRDKSIYKLLAKLKRGSGMEGKVILRKLPGNLRDITEASLRKHHLAPMVKRCQIKNTPGIGYHLP